MSQAEATRPTKVFLLSVTFCLLYLTQSRLPTAFIGDNPIKVALSLTTVLFSL